MVDSLAIIYVKHQTLVLFLTIQMHVAAHAEVVKSSKILFNIEDPSTTLRMQPRIKTTAGVTKRNRSTPDYGLKASLG